KGAWIKLEELGQRAWKDAPLSLADYDFRLLGIKIRPPEGRKWDEFTGIRIPDGYYYWVEETNILQYEELIKKFETVKDIDTFKEACRHANQINKRLRESGLSLDSKSRIREARPEVYRAYIESKEQLKKEVRTKQSSRDSSSALRTDAITSSPAEWTSSPMTRISKIDENKLKEIAKGIFEGLDEEEKKLFAARTIEGVGEIFGKKYVDDIAFRWRLDEKRPVCKVYAAADEILGQLQLPEKYQRRIDGSLLAELHRLAIKELSRFQRIKLLRYEYCWRIKSKLKNLFKRDH
ncbi:unnamed protein product, partial [marine sediment metagenome]